MFIYLYILFIYSFTFKFILPSQKTPCAHYACPYTTEDVSFPLTWLYTLYSCTVMQSLARPQGLDSTEKCRQTLFGSGSFILRLHHHFNHIISFKTLGM